VADNLPKARRVDQGSHTIVYVLIGVVVVLILVIVGLLLGGDLFDDQPQSILERDYELLLEGLAENPDDPSVLMTLAEVEYELGKTSDAVGHAQRAYEVGVDVAGIPYRYAQIMVQENELGMAREALEAEIELDERGANPEPLFLMAQVEREDGNIEVAIVRMEEGLQIAYYAADMRILYAEMLEEAGRDEDAIAQLREALRFLAADSVDSPEAYGRTRAIEALERLGVTYEETETVNPHEGDGSTDSEGE
jgi:tetratricopeptide (TPR) repeat protein